MVPSITCFFLAIAHFCMEKDLAIKIVRPMAPLSMLLLTVLSLNVLVVQGNLFNDLVARCLGKQSDRSKEAELKRDLDAPLKLEKAIENQQEAEETAPIVSTRSGRVQGFRKDGVDVFFGIPYARPPIDSLRMEKPQEVESWEGVLELKQTAPLSCYPHATPDWLNAFVMQGDSSEDCLLLNIFTPSTAAKSNPALLPVLFVIHGGGFEIGASAQFGNYTEIGANYVKQGIVVVSVQYRLGELGFASTGDAEMPGNLGLWDQTQALKFVHENIQSFGGDPHQVTVMGQSAGAVSASVLGLSPHSRKYFKRSIQMSGSGLASWVYGSRVVEQTQKLAEQLECAEDVSIKECLKDKATTPTKMMAAVTTMGVNRPAPNCIVFGPRFDGDFFPKPPMELIQEAPKMPTLVGFTQLESLIFTILTGQNSTLSSQMLPWSVLDTYNGDAFREYVRSQVVLPAQFEANQREGIAEQIYDFYVNGHAGQQAAKVYQDSTFFIRQYTELIADLMFVTPIVQEIREKAAAGWTQFMYVNNYFNPTIFNEKIKIHENYHTNDLNYLFSNPNAAFPFTAEDTKIQTFLLDTFRAFIKTGSPSAAVNGKQFHWPPVSKGPHLKHVRIVSPEPKLVANPTDVMNRLAFWENLNAQHGQFNFIQEVRNN